MAGESFGDAPSERAERLVPGARTDELAKHYPGDPEIEELAHRARLSRALAVAAFVTAEQDFDRLRDAVVARMHEEPLKIHTPSGFYPDGEYTYDELRELAEGGDQAAQVVLRFVDKRLNTNVGEQ